MSIPLCATSEYVCLADESHISILAAASLRQVASIDMSSSSSSTNKKSSSGDNSSAAAAAAAIAAVFVDPNTSAITTVDVDGAIVTRQPTDQQQQQQYQGGSRKAAVPLTASGATLVRYPHLLTASSARKKKDPEADVSVVTATICCPPAGSASLLGGAMPAASAFFFPADTNLVAQQASALSGAAATTTTNGSSFLPGGSSVEAPLVVSALLSDGTVVHGELSMARPVPAIGTVPGNRKSRLIFSASPVLPLAVVAQHGSNTVALLYKEPEATLVGSQQEQQEDAPVKQQKKKTGGKKASADDSTKKEEEEGEGELLSGPIFVTVPVAVASIAVHPSRRSVAIGGVRGEIVVIHDILSFSGKGGGNSSFFSDHWHHTPLTSLCFAGGPDGPMLLSGASEGCICVWNVGSNYARTNISLGTGITEVAKITSILLAADSPSRCVVCVGEGDVQIAAVDLSYRRMVARRDGLTAGGGGMLGSASSDAAFGDESAMLLSAPVQWMGGAAVTAVFLYSRRSGRIRLYDPYERRSLRTSVLTASVETVPLPPTVGLQRVASTPNGRRIAVFESSAEPVMPPAIRWLVYDSNMRRFRQVQQAIDPHSGETQLTGMVWVQEQQQQQLDGDDSDNGGSSNAVALITCSEKRIKVWMTATDSMAAKAPAGNNKRKRKRDEQKEDAAAENHNDEADDHKLMMNCVADIVLPHHPALSLIGAIKCATLSADQSVLYVAGDLVAAIDARHWFNEAKLKAKKNSSGSNSNSKKATAVEEVAVTLAAPNQPNLGAAHTVVPTSNGGVVAAYHGAVAIFGISGGAFRCRAVIPQQQQVLALTAASSSSSSSSSDFVVSLNQLSSKRFEVSLIDTSRGQVVARSPWHSHYAPASTSSFALLGGVDATTAGGGATITGWRCSVGVATLQRGFRTLSVLFKSAAAAAAAAAASPKKGSDAAQQQLVSVAPAVTSATATGAAERLAMQDQVSSFFRHAEDATSKGSSSSKSPYSGNTVAGSERSLFASCGDRVQIAKSAARYGTEVLGATTFFATPSMSVVAASVFDKLENQS